MITTQTLLDGASSTETGKAWSPGVTDVSVQVEGISGDTVLLEATNDGSNWFILRTSTTDEAITISNPYSQIRSRVSVYSAGNITVTAARHLRAGD